ncbi:transglutaminase domain-containing protein [Paenibacillus chungangensis]|uniref:Transglutaminase domain-containing protein n=1 Tax=Paenibacillus chungangensis TaxID=696535 RepID=A0ABW3HX41_9BACL
MRKHLLIMICVAMLVLPTGMATAADGNNGKWLDTSELDKGVVTVKYAVKPNVKTKVMIMKGEQRYTYQLHSGDDEESFPLQMGNGKYRVLVLEHLSEKSYKVLKSEYVQLALKDANKLYLNSVQNVKWTSTDEAIKKAAVLTKGLETDAEKVKAIYQFIITTIKYDEKLAKTVTTDYLPDIDQTLSEKKDICYGYAALFGAMMRSLDVPTKLVMGEADDIKTYHAWNEVFLNGEWVVIDTTIDAGAKNAEMVKDSSKYSAQKVY